MALAGGKTIISNRTAENIRLSSIERPGVKNFARGRNARHQVEKHSFYGRAEWKEHRDETASNAAGDDVTSTRNIEKPPHER